MPDLNRCYLMGNSTRDVELKHTQNNKAFCNFSIAVNDRIKKPDGSWADKVTFVDLTALGRTAEVAAQYVQKGTPVHIEGRLEVDQWDDKTTGEKRSKLKVVVDRLQLLGQKGEGGQSRQQSSQPAARKQAAGSSQPYGQGEYGTEASGEPPSQVGLEEVPW